MRRGAQLLLALAALALAAVAALASQDAGAPKPSPTVTFTKQIAPIVFEKCASCHHPGGSGPFSLLTFEDVRKRAKLISSVTESRYMPPWLAEPGYGEFGDVRRLSDEQIAIIKRWVDEGAVEGAASDLPPVPKFNEGWQLGQPDLVIKMDRPYTLAAGGADVFRNFVLNVPITSTKYVRAVEILPGNKKLVHHANMLVDRSGALRRRDQQDPEVGFAGMDVAIESESFEPDSHFLFWKPGSVPQVEPDGMAWRLDPTDALVINMHMQPSGKPETIQASVGLYFTDTPPSRFPMLVQLEHDGAIDIPAGKADFLVSDDFTLPIDVDVLGVYPHAHYIGKDLQAYATLPDGTRQWLIWIKRWDLNWQAVYQYAKPVFLPKGTVVSMRYTYDNSATNPRNPNRPPKRVVSGDNSTDEMGHFWLQVLPRTPDDARIVLQEAVMRQRLRKYPADYSAHFNLGSVLQSTGKLDEAVEHYTAALAARPDSPTVLNSLGTAFQQANEVDAALAYYGRAVKLDPTYVDARYNLGNALLSLNRPAEAIEQLREVLRLRPNDANAYNSLGSAFVIQGNLAQAAPQYEQAIRLDPNNTDAHGNLGYVYAMSGQLAKAVAEYEQVLRLRPDDADARDALRQLREQMRQTPQ